MGKWKKMGVYPLAIPWSMLDLINLKCDTKSSLVGGGIPTPLKHMSSSVGIMTFPIYGQK